MKLKLLTAAMLAMAIAPMQANAAVATATLQLTATVVAPTGSVLAAGPLAFGSVVHAQTGSATTSFDVTVTNGVPYTVSFGFGLHGGGNVFYMNETTGKQAGAFSAHISYKLWSDSAKVAAYLPGTASAISGVSGSGVAQTYTLYSETIPNPVQPAGNYADTITITVTY